MTIQPFDFSYFPTLTTQRLHLREMTSQDGLAILNHLSNPQVTRKLDMQPLQTLDDALEWLRWMDSFFHSKDGLRWGITLKSDGMLIGSAGLSNWNRDIRFAEIGYDFAQPFWGQGYATEVTQALIHFGFQQMQLNRIEADIVDGNDASIHILEKFGFQHEGMLRERFYKDNIYHHVHLYALLKQDA